MQNIVIIEVGSYATSHERAAAYKLVTACPVHLPFVQDRALTSLLDSTRVLILDEADNLLDMGFR